MLSLALRNLTARKARTALALTGLVIAILGIVALISVSRGIQALLSEALSLVPGVLVLEKDVPSLGFSSLPLDLGPDLAVVTGVAYATPQVYYPAFEVEGENLLLKADPLSIYLVLGVDDRAGAQVAGLEGRWLDPGAAEVVIPRAAAERFRKRLGDRLHLQGRELEITGVFNAGSLLFDRCLIVPLAIAREMAGKGPGLVSTFYLGVEDDERPQDVAAAIEARFPRTHAWTMQEVGREAGSLWAKLDLFLLAIASIAVFVGATGIVNTMLMSVIERTGELGILRAVGWTRRDVVRLILLESAALGLLGGLIGTAVGVGAVGIAGAFLPLKPVVTPGLMALCVGLALVLGVSGGVYPAWRAARLDPIAAIRT